MKKKNNSNKQAAIKYKKKGCCHHTVLTVDAVLAVQLSGQLAVLAVQLSSINLSSPCYIPGVPKTFLFCVPPHHSLQYLSHKLNDEIDLAPHTTRAHHNIIYTQ